LADLVEVQRFRLGVERDVDADPLQHRHDRRADRLVVDVTVVRAVQGDREAFGVPGVLEQLFRLLRIVGVRLVHVLLKAIDTRCDHQSGRGRGAAHDHPLDRIEVDRVREGLANPLILERVLAGARHVEQLVPPLVHAEEDGAQLRPLEHLDIGVALEAPDVLQRHRVHQIDLAGEPTSFGSIVSRKLAHGGNPVTRWMAANVAVAQDPAGNLRPAKDKSTERIDGIVALIMAIGRAMLPGEQPVRSVYEDRGILTL
jgi:hypothetical protein